MLVFRVWKCSNIWQMVRIWEVLKNLFLSFRKSSIFYLNYLCSYKKFQKIIFLSSDVILTIYISSNELHGRVIVQFSLWTRWGSHNQNISSLWNFLWKMLIMIQPTFDQVPWNFQCYHLMWFLSFTFGVWDT